MFCFVAPSEGTLADTHAPEKKKSGCKRYPRLSTKVLSRLAVPRPRGPLTDGGVGGGVGCEEEARLKWTGSFSCCFVPGFYFLGILQSPTIGTSRAPRADKDGPSLLSVGFSRLLPVPTRRTLEGAGGRPEADWDAGVVSGLPSALPTEKQTRRETRPPSPGGPDGKRNFSSADGSVLPSANRGACGNIWKAERTGC